MPSKTGCPRALTYLALHQQQRNVRLVRLDASGAPGARAPTLAKSLSLTEVPKYHSSRRNGHTHLALDAPVLPTLLLTHPVR